MWITEKLDAQTAMLRGLRSCWNLSSCWANAHAAQIAHQRPSVSGSTSLLCARSVGIGAFYEVVFTRVRCFVSAHVDVKLQNSKTI